MTGDAAGGGGRLWRIGELADSTGLTVRTLHHYEDCGLLSPSARTPGGHRLYDERDVRRLYRVRARRDLGLSLTEMRDVLASADTKQRSADRARGAGAARFPGGRLPGVPH